MPLKLNSAAGGSVTLDVGSTASTYTLVFPSLSGTILTTDTSGNFVIPSGNLNLSGTGQRITGDMSNATIANRLAFQNSITNAGTALQIAPNGSAKNSQLNWETDSAMLNGVSFQINANEGLGEVRLQNGIRGTGTYLPTTFYTGGSERMRIDTSGLVGIATAGATAYGSLTVGGGGQPAGGEPSSRPNIEIWQGSPSINDAGGIDLRGSSSGSGYGFRISAIDSTGVHLVIGNRSNSTTYTERMRIDSSGNVGIGTASPGTKLMVQSSALADSVRWTDNANSNGFLGTISGASTIFSSTSLAFGTGSTTYTERMRIDTSGNVGIGTSSPSAKLQIIGSTTVSSQANVAAVIGAGVTSELLLGSINGNNPFVASQGAYPLSFRTNNSEAMRIDSSGNVGINTTSPSTYSSANKRVLSIGKTDQIITLGSYYEAGVGQHAFINSSSNTAATGTYLIFQAGSSETMRITNTGDVSIGTQATYGKLLVYGNAVNFSPSADNTSNGIGACVYGTSVATATSAVARLYLTGNNTAHAGTLDLCSGSVIGSTINMYNVAGTKSVYFNTNSDSYINGGNVGIGTSSPSTKLDVSVAGGMARVGGGSGNNLIQSYTGSVGGGIWAGGVTRFYSTGAMTLSTNATIGTGAPTGTVDAVTIDSSGNVGIGTTSIIGSNRLSVVGGGIQLSGGTSAQAGVRIQYASSTATFAGINNDNNAYNALAFATGASEAMRIDTSGRVTMPSQPYAAGSCASAYTLSASSFANGFDVIYGNVDINVGSCYNNTTGKFTAPVAGAYLVMYTILINAGSSTAVDYRLSLSINNAQTMTGSSLKPSGLWPSVYISNIVYLNANDTVKARFWNDSGTGASHADANYNRFSIMLLG